MTNVIYLVFEIISLIFLKLAYDNKTNCPKVMWKIKKSSIFLTISFIFLSSLVCFRGVEVGRDTQAYVNVFIRIVNGTASSVDLSWIGPGYRIICKTIGIIFGSKYYILNFIIGFLTMYLFYKTIWENSNIPWLSMWIFISTCLYFQTFNQARQMLAIAIIFYSIKYIDEKKFKKYLIGVLLAASIHTSAIIMLPLYFIGRLEVNKKNITKYILLSIILYLGMIYIRKLLLMTTYGQIYFGTDYDVEGKTSTIVNLLVRIILLITTLILGNKEKKVQYKSLYNMAILCVISQLLTINTYIFGRITTYFFTSFILLIPNVIPKKNNQLIQLICFVAFALYYYVYYTSTASAMGVTIYKFFA
mgnify:CR=1 FL=1